MSLVGFLIGKEKNYLFSDNCQYLDTSILRRAAPRQFRIQKFKNFVIAYDGSPEIFQKFVSMFNLDSFPEPLTKSWLMRNFYLDFLDFLVKEANASIENGMLMKCDFGIMILGQTYCFDIGDEYLYEVEEFNAMGDDLIAFNIYDMFKNKYDDRTLLKIIMNKSVKYAYKTSYPFIIVESNDLNHYRLIEKDGTETIHNFEEFWRK